MKPKVVARKNTIFFPNNPFLSSSIPAKVLEIGFSIKIWLSISKAILATLKCSDVGFAITKARIIPTKVFQTIKRFYIVSF